jgi:hypothetical protein
MSAPAASAESDPHRIPLLVGVVGHRDLVPSEVPAIRAAVEKLLRALRAAQPDVQIKLLSSQAEGADLLVADVAHELGIELIALLPFPAVQCRAELTSEAARSVFDRTMAGAEKLELARAAGSVARAPDEPGAARDRQFERAGEVIARYSSLMIAVWDGLDTEHRAGTARAIERRRGRIDAGGDDESRAAPHGWLLAADNDLIYEIRCSRLTSPAAAPSAAADVRVIGFVTAETTLGGIDLGIPPELATLLAQTAEFNRDVREYGGRIARFGRPLASPAMGPVPDALRYVDRLFTASDWLAVHFRRCSTRALMARFALWALMAFLLLAFRKTPEGVFGFVNIVAVLFVFGLGWLLALWARRRAWDRRYLDYRALAEGLRVDFYWALAGVRARFDEAFAHETFLQKHDARIEWIRTALRTVTLRCALHEPAALPNGFEHALTAWIGDGDPMNGSGQLRYYRQRAMKLSRRLEIAEYVSRAMLIGGLVLALVLAVDVALRLVNYLPVLPPRPRGLMLMAFALLTADTAIFEIYLAEKADRSLIRQYQHMDALFSYAANELRAARTAAEKLGILRALGHACLAEHAQWILSQRDKRIDAMRW